MSARLYKISIPGNKVPTFEQAIPDFSVEQAIEPSIVIRGKFVFTEVRGSFLWWLTDEDCTLLKLSIKDIGFEPMPHLELYYA